jgi:hypothetical protein
MRAPRALIGMLQKDSEVLLEITEDFLKRRGKIRLISFYELEFTSIGPFLKKMVSPLQTVLVLTWLILCSDRRTTLCSFKRAPRDYHSAVC